MANKGLSMRKVREVLRLHYAAGLSTRAIARSLKVSPATVGKYIRRPEVQGLSWPLPEPLDDAALERRLFPAPVLSATQRPLPQWSEVHRELRQQDVTLALVWQEYKAAHPGGLQYSWFCDQYRAWASKLDVVMRQEHRAGEKLFVDYAGRTVAVVDRHTGELRQAQVFVAVLGASNYTFAEATWTQTLPDWIASHVRAFEFLGGCSELVIPDNLGSAVSRAHRYEPDTNPTYHDLARHYGVAVLPARVRKPRDKAKAEVGVQIVQRWILAALRHRTFFSLGELNAAIAKLLERLCQSCGHEERERVNRDGFGWCRRMRSLPATGQPSSTAPTVSTASRTIESAKWMYLSVVCGLACPSSRAMASTLSPCLRAKVAWAWRRSWRRTSDRSASARTRCQNGRIHMGLAGPSTRRAGKTQTLVRSISSRTLRAARTCSPSPSPRSYLWASTAIIAPSTARRSPTGSAA